MSLRNPSDSKIPVIQLFKIKDYTTLTSILLKQNSSKQIKEQLHKERGILYSLSNMWGLIFTH